MEINNSKPVINEKASIIGAEQTGNTAIFKKNRNILFAIAILSLILDQVSKLWVSANLHMMRPINILGDYFRLFLVYNTGLIWGIPFKSNLSYYVLPIIGVIVVIFIGYKSKNRFLSISYGLIIGGALGNLIDRIRLGHVIDFIDMGYKNIRWATYNLADMSLVAGLVMVLAHEIFKSKKSQNA